MNSQLLNTEFCSDTLTEWAIRPWVQLALRAIFLQLLQFHLFVQCSRFLSVIAFVSHHICFKQNLAQIIMLVADWTDRYGIHHWKIFRNSYEKLAWVGFGRTTTELCSDALTEWAITPWFSSHSEPTLYSYSSFISLFSVHVLFRSLSSSVAIFALSEIPHK